MAWCSSTKRGGIGVIARNHRREIVEGYHGSEAAGTVEYLEAWKVFEGVKLEIEKKWENVVIESDAISVINPNRGVDKSWRI